jgi:Transposase DDE domain
MTGNWFGKLFADKGCIATWLTQWYQEWGVGLITKVRNNMKPLKNSAFERAILSGRSLVETVFDGLINLFLIEHTHQRWPMNFTAYLFPGILAYCLFPNQPKWVLAAPLTLRSYLELRLTKHLVLAVTPS